MPYPSVPFPDNDNGMELRRTIDKVNNVTTTSATNTTTTTTTTESDNQDTFPTYDENDFDRIEQLLDEADNNMEDNDEEDNDDNATHDYTNDTTTVGGRILIVKRIYNTVVELLIRPMIAYHDQMCDNEEAKRIKAALTSSRLDDTSARVAQVLGNEAPVPQPILCRLIKETNDVSLKGFERRLQSLEDKQSRATSSKKVRGNGTKQKGTSIAAKSNAPTKKKVSFQEDKKSKSTNRRTMVS
jgi:hypothetical protein